MARTFTVELDSDLSREELRREILVTLSGGLGSVGYKLESDSDAGITYAREYRPYAVPAVILGVLLLFPFLLLLVKDTERIVFTFLGPPERTQLVIVGQGPRALRRHLTALAT
jgi:hypothetical protein